MLRTHDREVSAVDCGNLAYAVPFSYSDDRSVGASQRQITVLTYEGCHPGDVAFQQVSERERLLAWAQRAQERRLRGSTEMFADQEPRFGYEGGGTMSGSRVLASHRTQAWW
jgi:hypothetical protein